MKGEVGVTRSMIDEPISWISKEIKWKVKVLLLKVSLMNFFFGSGQMKSGSGVTRSIIDKLQSWDIQGDGMEE